MSEERKQGVIVSLHQSASRYSGSYGEIIDSATGKIYVFSGGHFFRNFSIPEVGGMVTFDVVAYSYATNIDRIDKHAQSTTRADLADRGGI